MEGFIHSVETMGLVDGPGVRSVVFMQGCPLRCKYCHNPDTWQIGAGTKRTVEDLIAQLVRMKPYFRNGGGVTFSGGEPLCQAEFLTECMKQLKQNGIHTCIDTSGSVSGDFSELLKYTDLVLYDCKHHVREDYRELTGGNISVAEDFLRQLQEAETPLWIRHVVVPQITDSAEHMQSVSQYIKSIKNVERVELLPYHVLGLSKYTNLGIANPLGETQAMDKELCSQLQKLYFS